MCMRVWPECMSVYHVCPWYCTGQKRASDTLALELPVVVGAGSEPRSSGKAEHSLNCSASCPSPRAGILKRYLHPKLFETKILILLRLYIVLILH